MTNSTANKSKSISPETWIGWIGTGVMGLSMCNHVLSKGYKVTVYNRTKSKAQPLLAGGARWAETPRAVAEQSHVVFTMVGFPEDVREVYFGEGGILALRQSINRSDDRPFASKNSNGDRHQNKHAHH